MVGLGPPTKAGCVNIPWPSSSSSRLAGLSSVGDTGEPVIGVRGLETDIPQALAARRTPGTSWTLAYHRRRWGSWSRALATRACRERYQRKEIGGWGRMRQEKNREILIKWLIWPVISTGAKSQVPTQFTDYTAGQDRRGPSRRNIKTLMAGGKSEVKHSNEEGFKCVCARVCLHECVWGTGERAQTDSRWDLAGPKLGPHSHVHCGWRWPLTGDTLGWVWNWKPVEHSWLLWELQFVPTV